MYNDAKNVCVAESAGQFSTAGAATGPSLPDQIAKSNAQRNATAGVERSTAAQEVMHQMDVIIGRLMNVSDRAEGLADRLLGGYPENGKTEQKPYPSGMIGEIARRLDTLAAVATAIELHVDRLQRLG